MNRNFFINPQDVDVWFLSFPEHMGRVTDYRRILSADEIQRADRFRLDLHQYRFIIARAILRKLLGSYLKIPPDELQFNVGPFGKPSLANDLDLHFNLAHSHDFAVFAFRNKAAVGIDTEKRQEIAYMPLAKRYFTQDEVKKLSTAELDKQSFIFYRMWTAKEAFVKLQGGSIFSTEMIPDFDITQSSQTIQTGYLLEFQSLHPDYETALVTEIPVNKIQYFQYS